jgi:hypothetical protein
MFGLETFNDNLMKKMDEHENSTEQVLNIIELFDRLGMMIYLNTMYGFPCELFEEFKDALSRLRNVFNKCNNATFNLNELKLCEGIAISKNISEYRIQRIYYKADSLVSNLGWETVDGITDIQISNKSYEYITQFNQELFGSSFYQGEEIHERFRLDRTVAYTLS